MIDEKYSIAFEYIGKEVTPQGAPRGMGGILAGLLAGKFLGRRAIKATPKAMPKAATAPKLKADDSVNYAEAAKAAEVAAMKQRVMKNTVENLVTENKALKIKASGKVLVNPSLVSQAIPGAKQVVSKNLEDEVRTNLLLNKRLQKKTRVLQMKKETPYLQAANKAEPVKLEGVNDKIFVSEMKKLTENIKNQEKVGDK